MKHDFWYAVVVTTVFLSITALMIMAAAAYYAR